MAQVFDASLEPATTGYILGATLRKWDALLRYIQLLEAVEMIAVSAPALSGAGQCVFYFDNSGKLKISENGGAYTNIVGTQPPFSDANTLVANSSDPTKLIKFSAASVATGTTRTYTLGNADMTLAGIDFAQTWTATQTMRQISPSASNTYDLGSTTLLWRDVFCTNLKAASKVLIYDTGYTASWYFTQIGGTTGFGLLDPGNTQRILFTSSTNTAQFTAHVMPTANNTYTLGVTATRWSTVYTVNLDVNGSVASSLVPTGSVNLGSTTNPWTLITAGDIRTNTKLVVFDATWAASWYWTQIGGSTGFGLIDVGNTQRILFTSASSTCQLTAHTMATATNTYDLGATATRWRQLFVGIASIGITSGTGGYLEIEYSSSPPGLSSANNARMYFDGTNIKVSKAGAAYTTLI